MIQILIGRKYPKVLLDYLAKAQKSVDVLMYDWRWYPREIGSNIQKVNAQIIQLGIRGIKVRGLSNNRLDSSLLLAPNVDIQRFVGSKTLHAKLVIIDEKYLFLGSHNFSKNAFDLNHEISFVTDDGEAVREALDHFNSFFK